MIVRVSIENLVIVERAEFEPGSGLTAVTGETGAGKTLLASAIRLLFGADADARFVGPYGETTFVEGEFEADEAFWEHPDVAVLAELRPEPDAPLVLARKVTREGRSRALAWGRTVTKGDLAAAGRLLVATAGQHSQRRLLSGPAQRDLLDASGGADAAALLQRMAGAWAQLQAARREQERVLAEVERLREGADQLRDDLERIEAVGPSVEDEQELLARRERARHRESLLSAMSAASRALDGGGDGGAIDMLGRAYAELESASAHDAALGPVAESLLAAQSAAVEVASDIRARAEDLVADDAGSLDEIEDRLSAYDELQRRFGGTTEAVLARWEQLGEQAALAGDTEGGLAAAEAAVRAAEAEATAVAAELGTLRRTLATRLAVGVREQLAELGMEGSQFEVAVEDAVLSASGADLVELRLSPSKELEPRPVAEVASGGELSRIALALHVLSGAREAGTIIFDEIDAGIGGHTGHAIGSLLRRLGEQVQVICITHLPQVAARAGAHVVIEKADGRTSLRTLGGEDEVVDELCRMLGADPAEASAREHALGLRGPRVAASRVKGARAKGGRAAQEALPLEP